MGRALTCWLGIQFQVLLAPVHREIWISSVQIYYLVFYSI